MGALEAFSQLLGAWIQTNWGFSILSTDPALLGASCPCVAPTPLGSTPQTDGVWYFASSEPGWGPSHTAEDQEIRESHPRLRAQ